MKTLSHKVVTARKKHTCDWCLSTIKIGEKYHTSFNIEGRESYTWKSHTDCQKLAEIFLEDENDGEGLTQDEFDSYLFESYRDITSKPCSLKTQEYSEILNVVKEYLLKQK